MSPPSNPQNTPTTAAAPASETAIAPLRDEYRAEVANQIVHDSIHRRSGWTKSYLFTVEDRPVGFGSIAIAGPWMDKPTAFEFYITPTSRRHTFALFESFLASSQAKFLEFQTSLPLAQVVLHTYGSNCVSEKIVYQDEHDTTLCSNGATLKRVSTTESSKLKFDARQGACEWVLEFEGEPIGSGGLMFHYNLPYCDIYMDIKPPFRRRGYGAYMVQELKRVAYAMDGIPAARCDPSHIASQRTLRKSGFAPYAHILVGPIATRRE